MLCKVVLVRWRKRAKKEVNEYYRRASASQTSRCAVAFQQGLINDLAVIKAVRGRDRGCRQSMRHAMKYELLVGEKSVLNIQREEHAREETRRSTVTACGRTTLPTRNIAGRDNGEHLGLRAMEEYNGAHTQCSIWYAARKKRTQSANLREDPPTNETPQRKKRSARHTQSISLCHSPTRDKYGMAQQIDSRGEPASSRSPKRLGSTIAPRQRSTTSSLGSWNHAL
ncbi:hypothetical protein C8R44DRAFT_747935 [Mycena epipterygia]|nr:hypothetical protein C8R44DRAFT_747935 [Mycena epipterygia]